MPNSLELNVSPAQLHTFAKGMIFSPRKSRKPSFALPCLLQSTMHRRWIPKEEVQFIHDADTEAKKAELLLPIFSSQKRVEMSILSGFLHSLQWFGPQKLPRYFQA